MGISVLGRNSDNKPCGCNYCGTIPMIGTPVIPANCNDSGSQQVPPNPDPTRWHLLSMKHIGDFLVVKLRYPDCTNFEGEKILVYRGTWEDVKKQGSIDPHFSNKRGVMSPIARFQPTAEGWLDACRYARMKDDQS